MTGLGGIRDSVQPAAPRLWGQFKPRTLPGPALLEFRGTPVANAVAKLGCTTRLWVNGVGFLGLDFRSSDPCKLDLGLDVV